MKKAGQKEKQKKTKNNSKSLVYAIAVVALLLIIIFFISRIIPIFIPSYKLLDRTENIKETEEKYGDDVLSWLRIQGTNIDLPVIYRASGLDVQKTDYDFAWSYPKTDKLTNRAIFTSHNVLNVSSNPLLESEGFRRFENLPAFLYPDFAKKNQFIQYTIDGQNYLYQIFSVSLIKEDDVDYDHDQYSSKKMKEYIDKSLEESYYNYDLKVDSSDSIITLITCTRFFGATDDYSLKIDARKVRKNEKAKLVDIRVKSNYHIVEETMKEGEENETA